MMTIMSMVWDYVSELRPPMMIMSVGWDCFSELWPPMSLLFITQMIWAWTWWNDVDGGKLPIHPPDLSGKPTSSHLVASRRNWWKEWEFGLAKYFYSHLQVIFFFTFRKIVQHGASSFTTSAKEGMLWIFIIFKNPSPWMGLNQRTLGPIASTLTITPPRQLRRDHKPSPLK
jgi:hypothetical protein